ncbi:MAG: hypothetical protein Q4B68_07980 [Bacteroidales bacterium]|nr:hypothetical protein [Bacteroidales bacterium]
MKKRYIFAAILMTMAQCICAQNDTIPALEFGAELDTEVETDFGHRVAWVNYLRFDLQWNINRHHSLQVATQHLYSLGDDPVVEELQLFSNIRDENTPIALAKLGYNYFTNLGEDASLSAFVGVRTENEDYFCSPLTSFFLNSSDGIFPTAANNCPLPNYMLAAMGVHFEFSYRNFTFKNSLYNGEAGKTTDGRAFRINPGEDGVVNMTQFTLSRAGKMPFHYDLGGLYHSKVGTGALWLLGEQAVATAGPCTISLLGQLSWAFGNDLQSKDYQGLGIVFDTEERLPMSKFGIMWHRANFNVGVEQSVEVTANFNVIDHLSIQPSAQYISGVYEKRMAGILRAVVEF